MVGDTVMKHAVGRATLNEGFAVPRAYEQWIGAPPRGNRRPICLVFGESTITATLRTIDTDRAPVQVKYENAAGRSFRAWLAQVFHASVSGPCGEYFELRVIEPDTLQVIPHPNSVSALQRLRVADWLFHGGVEALPERYFPRNEISAVIHNVEFDGGKGQAYYNRAFNNAFRSWAWTVEHRVVPELGLKCDFAKGAVRAEVEFGNARTYYQDYIKFLVAKRYGAARVGVLIVPDQPFAKHLCMVGKAHAVSRGRHSYSGMIHFGKVQREFRFLEFILSMPIAIVGVGLPGDSDAAPLGREGGSRDAGGLVC